MPRPARAPRRTATPVLDPSESAHLLWQEWRYRHEVIWRTFSRYGLVVMAVSLFPYFAPGVIARLRLAVLVFPLLGTALGLFAAWHLAAEYARFSRVSEAVRRLLGPLAPGPVVGANPALEKILGLRIGWVLPAAFLVAAIPGSFANALILLLLAFG
ncbi:MAG: hypothetical protein AB1449_04480 [Chloroflexota bacterium]